MQYRNMLIIGLILQSAMICHADQEDLQTFYKNYIYFKHMAPAYWFYRKEILLGQNAKIFNDNLNNAALDSNTAPGVYKDIDKVLRGSDYTNPIGDPGGFSTHNQELINEFHNCIIDSSKNDCSMLSDKQPATTYIKNQLKYPANADYFNICFNKYEDFNKNPKSYSTADIHRLFSKCNMEQGGHLLRKQHELLHKYSNGIDNGNSLYPTSYIWASLADRKKCPDANRCFAIIADTMKEQIEGKDTKESLHEQQSPTIHALSWLEKCKSVFKNR